MNCSLFSYHSALFLALPLLSRFAAPRAAFLSPTPRLRSLSCPSPLNKNTTVADGVVVYRSAKQGYRQAVAPQRPPPQFLPHLLRLTPPHLLRFTRARLLRHHLFFFFSRLALQRSRSMNQRESMNRKRSVSPSRPGYHLPASDLRFAFGVWPTAASPSPCLRRLPPSWVEPAIKWRHHGRWSTTNSVPV